MYEKTEIRPDRPHTKHLRTTDHMHSQFIKITLFENV